MRVHTNLAAEFADVCRAYREKDQIGKDIVTLVHIFGDENDGLVDQEEPDLRAAWVKFIEEHQHQMTVMPMVGLVLYNLVTYWALGQLLFNQMPVLEKMTVRDTVNDIKDEIDRRSAANNGNDPAEVPNQE